MWKQMGEPSMLLMDLRPMMYPVILITDLRLADEITKISSLMPYSAPKSPTVKAVHHLLGSESILAVQGTEWKDSRKMFNPSISLEGCNGLHSINKIVGFQPKYLASLMPSIVDHMKTFTSRLSAAAKSQKPVTIVTYTGALTADIIGQVALGYDMRAQTTKHGEGERGPYGIMTCITKILEWMKVPSKATNILHRMNFVRPFVLRRYEKALDERFATIVRERYQSRKESDRCIVDMALKNRELTPSLTTNVVHQLKTFFFAGEDTTAIVMAYAFLQLSRNKSALARLRAEHDALFGDKTEEILVTEWSTVLDKMEYTMAVMKETLRLHPPAGGTARMTPEGTGLVLGTEEDGKGCVDGAVLYVCHIIIQRDEKYWGPDAKEFKPERWLEPTFDVPPTAYRPFERGPRNCIGQELALLEFRVLLALTARRFDFEKVGYNGIDQEELFDIYTVTRRPVDDMLMRVMERDG
ncbi:MAG: hypothetical protein M1812_000980 [Candelaria pacifica]|nr:MAG: hypothetical protein M1812_000980 [Candelaria pacifica]